MIDPDDWTAAMPTVRTVKHDAAFVSTCWLYSTSITRPRAGEEHVVVERGATCTTCARYRQRMHAQRRTPPPLPAPERGRCWFCHAPLTGRQTKWCGPLCELLVYATTKQNALLGHLLDLHGARCWQCGSSGWEPGKPPDRWHRLNGARVCRELPDGSVCYSTRYGPPDPLQRFDVDHVRPLWSLTDRQRTQLRWWLPFNLQVLCTTCHKAKTRAEAADRARARRNEGAPTS